MGLAFSIAIFTKFTPAYDVSNSLFTDVYIAPWTRIVPYLIGIAAGYSMHTFKGKLPLDEVSIIIMISKRKKQHRATNHTLISI